MTDTIEAWNGPGSIRDFIERGDFSSEAEGLVAYEKALGDFRSTIAAERGITTQELHGLGEAALLPQHLLDL